MKRGPVASLDNMLHMILRILYIGLLLSVSGMVLYPQQIHIPFSDIDLKCSLKSDSSRIIIRSRSEYLRSLRIPTCNQAEFNFERYTLIGVQGSTGGCNLPVVEFGIVKDVENKTYYIHAIVYVYGACRRNNVYRRFLRVEKLDEDYSVQFELRKSFLH